MTAHGPHRHATGLYTDLYELRMVQSYLARGMTGPATFSLFIRPRALRPWYVAMGVSRLIEHLEQLRYGDDELEYLETIGVDERTRAFLADLEISGEIWAVPDGTVVLANEPILELTAPLPVAQLLETAVMNLVHYPTLVATKAARCALVAGGRPLADFGFRRAHGLETGVEAALAAYVGGGFATSNVEAGRRHGIRVVGTMAHSYVQAFGDEQAAFRAFAGDHPDDATLLVDTYDTVAGIRHAIDACREVGAYPRGLRLDSGDLGELAQEARRLLDDAGFHETTVIASGGVDEHAIHRLLGEGRPIDAFGVGTALVVSSDHPALDIVYKLVDYDGRPVAKYSGDKTTLPGTKQVHRGPAGPVDDVLSLRSASPEAESEPLLAPVWIDGEPGTSFDLEAARAHVEAGLSVLPSAWTEPPYPSEPPLPRLHSSLLDLSEQTRTAALGDVPGPQPRRG